jgi:hypothetical protein
MSDEKGGEEGAPQVDLSWLPEGHGALADGVYDAIVMGTGLKVRAHTRHLLHVPAIYGRTCIGPRL